MALSGICIPETPVKMWLIAMNSAALSGLLTFNPTMLPHVSHTAQWRLKPLTNRLTQWSWFYLTRKSFCVTTCRGSDIFPWEEFMHPVECCFFQVVALSPVSWCLPLFSSFFPILFPHFSISLLPPGFPPGLPPPPLSHFSLFSLSSLSLPPPSPSLSLQLEAVVSRGPVWVRAAVGRPVERAVETPALCAPSPR